MLPAGDYTLRLKRGLSATEKAFSIAAGDAINVAMTIDAGKLLVSGVFAPGGPKIENGFVVEIRKAPANAGADGEWVATNYEALSQFELPSGSYDVVASTGFAKRVTRAEVRSGAPTRIEVNLDAGTASIRTGNGKVIEIFDVTGGAERKYVQTSYDPTLTVALNAGSYVAVVEYADGRKVEKEFSHRRRQARRCRGEAVNQVAVVMPAKAGIQYSRALADVNLGRSGMVSGFAGTTTERGMTISACRCCA